MCAHTPSPQKTLCKNIGFNINPCLYIHTFTLSTKQMVARKTCLKEESSNTFLQSSKEAFARSFSTKKRRYQSPRKAWHKNSLMNLITCCCILSSALFWGHTKLTCLVQNWQTTSTYKEKLKEVCGQTIFGKQPWCCKRMQKYCTSYFGALSL